MFGGTWWLVWYEFWWQKKTTTTMTQNQFGRRGREWNEIARRKGETNQIKLHTRVKHIEHWIVKNEWVDIRFIFQMNQLVEYVFQLTHLQQLQCYCYCLFSLVFFFILLLHFPEIKRDVVSFILRFGLEIQIHSCNLFSFFFFSSNRFEGEMLRLSLTRSMYHSSGNRKRIQKLNQTITHINTCTLHILLIFFHCPLPLDPGQWARIQYFN